MNRLNGQNWQAKKLILIKIRPRSSNSFFLSTFHRLFKHTAVPFRTTDHLARGCKANNYSKRVLFSIVWL